MSHDPPTFGRRDVASYFAASALLASACARAPHGKIVAYGRQPEDTPGVARLYSTTMSLGGYATGLLAESHEGRPTKIEGNVDHPASLGGTSAIHQAQTLALYDPDRLTCARHMERPVALAELMQRLGKAKTKSLERVAILAEPTSSKALRSLLEDAASRGAKVFFHDPLPRTNVWAGAKHLFGAPLDPIVELSRADVVVALDADLFHDGPFHLRYARQRSERRRSNESDPGRLYVAEPALTVTGSVADHRLASRRADIASVAAALFSEVASLSPAATPWMRRMLLVPPTLPGSTLRWVRAAALDLAARGGRAVVVAGPAQPAEVHALVYAINVALASSCTSYVDPVVAGAGSSTFSVEPLLADIDAGRVDLLIMLGGNPAYTAPADTDFSRRVRGVRDRLYLAPYDNETARVANWLVPSAHFLESWDDACALDGTTSFTQPLLRPLYGGKTAAELLSQLLGNVAVDGRELLIARGRKDRDSFETAFREALRTGVLEGSTSKPLHPSQRADVAPLFIEPLAIDALEITFRPDTRVRDGAFTNDPWLLELPDPMTQQTWGNAALVGAGTARTLGVSTGDVVSIRHEGRALLAPVLVAPGHAEGSIALALGYGRAGGETLADGVGFDAGRLRMTRSLWAASNVLLAKTGKRADLVLAQTHDSMEGRDLAIDVTLADLTKKKVALAEKHATQPTFYALAPKGQVQWGMTIDLDACTGCQTCVVACQAENNIPVVGAEGVAKGRLMHWLRVDRYFEGEESDVSVRHQPLACVHCEKAPCEYVCPVGATVHSDDGLNEMVYNRCVGTRFCSNNCPYKVRRFNWLDYNRDKPATVRMAMNPDVTVRARGVMEKCTYCVQRIRETEIQSHASGKPIVDGDIKTACEQACPSNAITFGAVSDPASRVSRLRELPRAYALLNDLGTQPRTRYLARVENPSPELPR